jgi:uncharacterized protein (TIGR03435 family)
MAARRGGLFRQSSMRQALRSVCVGLLFLATMAGQSSSGGPKFEVASIKPSVPGPAVAGVVARSGGGAGGGGCPQRLKIDSSRVDIGCATPVMLIGYAFRFPPDRITGPEWMMGPGSTRFDIAAKIPQGVREDQVPEMVQVLLADRFRLVLHRGTTIQPIYALVVAKGGPKVKQSVAGAATEPDASPGSTGFVGEITERTTPNADGKGETSTMSDPQMGTVHVAEGPDLFERMDAPATTFEGLAELLDRMMPVGAPVIDMTGLKGRYQLVLDVSLNSLPKPAKTSIGDPAAMERELADRDDEVLKRFNDGLRKSGLQLERRRGPVQALVVDHWEKLPTGN